MWAWANHLYRKKHNCWYGLVHFWRQNFSIWTEPNKYETWTIPFKCWVSDSIRWIEPKYAHHYMRGAVWSLIDKDDDSGTRLLAKEVRTNKFVDIIDIWTSDFSLCLIWNLIRLLYIYLQFHNINILCLRFVKFKFVCFVLLWVYFLYFYGNHLKSSYFNNFHFLHNLLVVAFNCYSFPFHAWLIELLWNKSLMTKW